MSRSVRRVIVGQVSHLFDAQNEEEDDAVDKEEAAGKNKRTRQRRGGGGGEHADVLEDIAADLDLDDEADFVGTSVADIDRQVELEQERQLADADEGSESLDTVSQINLGADEAPADAHTAENQMLYQQALALMPASMADLVPRKRRRAARSSVNFGINAVLDRIDEPLYGEHDWIWNRDAAHTVTDEDARARQQILALTNMQTRALPPPRGTRKKYMIPLSLNNVRYECWMLLTTPKLYTTNVVSTFNLGVPVHLFYIINRMPGICFNPRCFAAAKLRCSKGTHLIFSGGSVVCAGANSVPMSRIACVECAYLLTRVQVMAEVSRFTVQNVVSTADAGFPIDLFELAIAYPINAHFDPECFPGLMFRLTTSQLVIIVFKSGKCIITGVDSRSKSLRAWRWFHSRVLWEFEMKSDVAHESEGDYRRRWRQKSSMIQSMCESVRDITTAALIQKLQIENDVGDIYNDQSHFGQLIDMTRRIGHAYEQSGARVLDLEDWVRTSATLNQLSKPLAIEAAPLAPAANEREKEVHVLPAALQSVLSLAQNVRLEFIPGREAHRHEVLLTPTNEPALEVTAEKACYIVPRNMVMGASDCAFVLYYHNGLLASSVFAHETAALEFVRSRDVPENHWVVRLDDAVESFVHARE